MQSLTDTGASTRRRVIALLGGALAGARVLPGNPTGEQPVRVAISETLLGDVNINDARASMLIWLKKMEADLRITVEISPKVFESPAEILERVRGGMLDSVAITVPEYRQVSDCLDPSQVLSTADKTMEQYLLLAKRDSGLQDVSHLRGRRIFLLKTPAMCVAPAWLTTILDEKSLPPADEFFGSIVLETKVSRIVLPVFFGQADACLTSKRGFDTMCELNPQVGRDLTPIASSPMLIPAAYMFHKNYRSPYREVFIKVLTTVRTSAAGRQMATLFQFDELTVRDSRCLAPALTLLERADRIRGRRGNEGRK